jgi:hypothetical protein
MLWNILLDLAYNVSLLSHNYRLNCIHLEPSKALRQVDYARSHLSYVDFVLIEIPGGRAHNVVHLWIFNTQTEFNRPRLAYRRRNTCESIAIDQLGCDSGLSKLANDGLVKLHRVHKMLSVDSDHCSTTYRPVDGHNLVKCYGALLLHLVNVRESRYNS